MPRKYRPRRRRPLADRFWEKVNRNGPTPSHRPELGPCWVWTAAISGSGYGKFFVNGRLIQAHWFTDETENGPLPEGLWVLHHCDNRPCVRPSHLFRGTPTDNVADMIAKGRQRFTPLPGDLNPARLHPERLARGERNAAAKTTAAIVVEMRQRYAGGGIRQSVLASEYGMAQSAVGAIMTGKSWAHVGGPITRLGKGGNQHKRRS